MKLRWIPHLLLFFSILGTTPCLSHADQFTYFDEKGKLQEIEAKIAGEGQKMFALIKADGKIQIVPQLLVRKRVISEGPAPFSSEQMVDHLKERFDPEFLRTKIEAPFIFALILDKNSEAPKKHRVKLLMKQCGRFMKNVEKMFDKFAKKVDLELTSPQFPLVLLIFELDDDFNKYALSISNGRGLSAGRISGFYSPQTNFLAIRLSECLSFEVPLHEAIHQQVYNRGVLNRLAPIPSWFNEGIATGFEGDGEKINGGPTRIHSSYSYLSQQAKKIEWVDVVTSDRPFQGDILAGDAYTHAWSLHWLLLTKYRDEYKKYFQLLTTKQTLIKDSATKRKEEFETIFGKEVHELQNEFLVHLNKTAKKQKFNFRKNKPGISVIQSNLGEVLINAVSRPDRGGQMLIRGKLKNISPLRPMSFIVTVTTDAGAYTRWHVPNVGVKRIIKLKTQVVNQWLPKARRGISRKFSVHIKSTPAESETAKEWANGNFPVPGQK